MKNPFELRFEILDLARRHLVEQFYVDNENWKVYTGEKPEYPSTSDIFKTADEFKLFVETA